MARCGAVSVTTESLNDVCQGGVSDEASYSGQAAGLLHTGQMLCQVSDLKGSIQDFFGAGRLNIEMSERMDNLAIGLASLRSSHWQQEEHGRFSEEDEHAKEQECMACTEGHVPCGTKGAVGVLTKSARREQGIQKLRQAVDLARVACDADKERMAMRHLGHAYILAGQSESAIGWLLLAERLFDAQRAQMSSREFVHVGICEMSFPKDVGRALQRSFLNLGRPVDALLAAERSRSKAFAASHASRNHIAPTSYEWPALHNMLKEERVMVVYYSFVEEEELCVWVIDSDAELVGWKRLAFTDIESPLNCDLATLLKDVRGELDINHQTNFVTCTPEQSEACGDDRGHFCQRLFRVNRKLAAFFNYLITPIQSWIEHESDLLIVPDGELFFVPFAALRDTKGDYLIESFSIRIVPSLCALASMNKLKERRLANRHVVASPQIVACPGGHEIGKNLKGTSWVCDICSLTSEARYRCSASCDYDLCADCYALHSSDTLSRACVAGVSHFDNCDASLWTLPAAESEAQVVHGLCCTAFAGDGVGVTIHCGAEATKQTLIKSMVTATEIIHIATHCLLDKQQLALYDAFLTYGELSNLPLRASLGVLSACDSGRGAICSDGVFGLSRALMVAGVTSVIASLWSIPDKSTENFMRIFYTHLLSDKVPAQKALQSTMIQMSKDRDEHGMPKYFPQQWAPFVLVGSVPEQTMNQ